MAPPKFSQIQSFSPLTSKGSLTNMTANDVRRQVVDAYKVIDLSINTNRIDFEICSSDTSEFPMLEQLTDTDGNGILDREELSTLIKKLGIPLKDPVMDTDFIFGQFIRNSESACNFSKCNFKARAGIDIFR